MSSQQLREGEFLGTDRRMNNQQMTRCTISLGFFGGSVFLGSFDCTDDQILFSSGDESFMTCLKKKPRERRP